jgi:hypothetical protein
LAREEELTWREEAQIYENALVKVSVDLDVERANAEATQKKYLDKMHVYTARAKHSLDLDKMLGKKKVECWWRRSPVVSTLGTTMGS